MMTILVQVFQAATGSLTAAQSYQQLDDQLRRIDTIIRSDLEGVTARFTPPLDPAQNLGYFEYAENEFADLQGEDSDDTSASPPRPPRAGLSPGGCGWVRDLTGTVLRQQCVHADHDHQRICRDHLFLAQWQPLSPRPADRTGAATSIISWPITTGLQPPATLFYPVTFAAGNPSNGRPVSR